MEQPFEIKNYRLVKGQPPPQNIKHHPLEKSFSSSQFTLDGQNFSLNEQFGSVYIGDQLSSLAVIKYKGKDQLEKINITLTITLESKQKEVERQTFQIQEIASEIKIPFQLRIEVLDSYVFVYKFEYKVRANQPQEVKSFTKGYRIQPKLPFKTDCRINPFLAPIYLIEYTFTNNAEVPLIFNKVDFKTDSPFEAIKIDNNSQHIIQTDEKEKVLFKVSVKPQLTQIYNDLLSNLQGEKQINIGSIILEWGSFGVYVGPSVPLNITSNDISVEYLPNLDEDKYQIDKISELKLNITNLTGKQLTIRPFIKEDETNGIKLLGVDNQVKQTLQQQIIKNFKLFQQSQSLILTVYILPIYTGIQMLKGLILINEQNNMSIPFKNNIHLQIDNKYQQKIDFTQKQDNLINLEMI